MTKEELLIELEKLEDNKKYKIKYRSENEIIIKAIKKKPIKRWRAKLNESYWMTNFSGFYRISELNDISDEHNYVLGNYFKTKEEAERYKERILIKQKLEDIALELNDGIEIDWSDCNQTKYYLFFTCRFDEISLYTNCFDKHEGTTYCLNKNFKDEAIERIGKKRLIKYLKEC